MILLLVFDLIIQVRYFLFLFQLLKYVPAFWGAVIIPIVLGLLILIQPFIGSSTKGHQFNVGFWWCLLAGSAGLTFLAFSEDRENVNHIAAVEEAEWQAERVIQIAQEHNLEFKFLIGGSEDKYNSS